MENFEMMSNESMEKITELIENRFPGTVIEMKDKSGKKVKGINFNLLKQLLSAGSIDDTEYYGLNWIGKKMAIAEANTPTRKRLKPVFEESKDWTTTGNLFIEGDNLDALKLLQKSYANRIKMIYIDPPYNTGNDFIYRDDYSLEEKFYEKHAEKHFGSKGHTQAYALCHSGWCSMMYPRLVLARNLLSEDGVIFISIDEYELDNLKKICNEIFGENNFITIIGLEITKTQGMKVKSAKAGSIVKNYEFILCYAKKNANKKIVKNLLFDRNEGYDTHFSYYIEKLNGEYILRNLADVLQENHEIYEEFRKYRLVGKNGRISVYSIEKAISLSGKVRKYLYNDISKNIYQQMACSITIDPETENLLDKQKIIEYNGYLLTKSTGGKLRQYGCLNETLRENDEYNSEYGRVTIRGNLWKGFYSDMMNIAKEGGVEYKNGKKPVRLIAQLAKWIGVKDGDIVLDFFAGSATTAHAVMELNALDLGRRNYIVIQLDEDLDEALKSATGEYKRIIQRTIDFLDSAGRPHILTELGKQRIINSGQVIIDKLMKAYGAGRRPKEKKKNRTDRRDDAGSLSENRRPFIDTGFRVFRLVDSNVTEDDFRGYLQRCCFGRCTGPNRTEDNPGVDCRNWLKSDEEKECSDFDLFYAVLPELGLPLTLNCIREEFDGFQTEPLRTEHSADMRPARW